MHYAGGVSTPNASHSGLGCGPEPERVCPRESARGSARDGSPLGMPQRYTTRHFAFRKMDWGAQMVKGEFGQLHFFPPALDGPDEDQGQWQEVVWSSWCRCPQLQQMVAPFPEGTLGHPLGWAHWGGSARFFLPSYALVPWSPLLVICWSEGCATLGGPPLGFGFFGT